MTPDVLILGDSHTNALRQGCERLGLNTDGLWFSGTMWHMGRFAFTRSGFAPVKMPSIRRQLNDLSERLGGGDPFASGIPVIASFGYHLGRLVPNFANGGYRQPDLDGNRDPEGLTASSAFLEEYIKHYRARHITLARRMARRAPFVMVAPPAVRNAPNFHAFQAEITRQLRAGGVTVFDPLESMLETGLGQISPDFVAPDGNHGTAQYGTEVIERLNAQNLLRPARPATQN